MGKRQAWKAGACVCTPSQLDSCCQEPLQLHGTTHQGSMTSYLYSPSMPDEQRCLLRRCFTLAVEAFLLRFSGTQLAAWAGNPRAVSPCGQLPVPSTPVPVQQGALAHSNCSIDSRVWGTIKAAYHASLRPFLPTARSRVTPWREG